MRKAEAILAIIRANEKSAGCHTVLTEDHRRAVCFESCKHGSEGGGWKRGRNRLPARA